MASPPLHNSIERAAARFIVSGPGEFCPQIRSRRVRRLGEAFRRLKGTEKSRASTPQFTLGARRVLCARYSDPRGRRLTMESGTQRSVTIARQWFFVAT